MSSSTKVNTASPVQRFRAQCLFGWFFVLLLGFLFVFIIALGVMMPEHEFYYFNVTYYTADVTNIAVDPTSCCEIKDCDCVEAGSGASTCQDYLDNLIQGYCGDGYFCCNRGNKGICHRDVSNRRCYSYCGTCFVVTGNATLTLANTTLSAPPKDVFWEEKCSIDDTSCRDEAVAEFTARNNSYGYVRSSEFEDFFIGELPPYQGCTYCFILAGVFGPLSILSLIIIIVSGITLSKKVALPPATFTQQIIARHRGNGGEMLPMGGASPASVVTASAVAVPVSNATGMSQGQPSSENGGHPIVVGHVAPQGSNGGPVYAYQGQQVQHGTGL
uniref:Uncharacterized protein n=1 Tax=Palpitomonas bilix TaxID=652834 RepID=A0A7S3D5S3_9EUKA|mmetsp:Transcript_23447/g.59297  ORF Transcript_23447/g.59297 Transcript_23447/m.59297 type:complete len:330 (+) Transcript_23447:146-1135(+)|eukprot:CAMPEP_0113893958 /NCGR_PEP_ID=MMETSP0780_2-20120614/16405_1 /TAXON_ID=652834 /ORGANISM="Palpitomonas bilix" /LENGTH=329 /DNA_ID=CAMNT_0000884353 /DNA_START=134 /DNA_END=1123 /DNA_ORIENTATION=+ /assembly_acc=CAM_ASM_000599